MQYGYPGAPPAPPKRSNTGIILLFVLGVPLALVLGTVLFCVVIVRKASSDDAAAKAVAQTAGKAFVPTLAKLAADPKALPPATMKNEKEQTIYTYADPAGIGLKNLRMLVAKDRPGAWHLTFDSSGAKLSAGSFGPDNGVTAYQAPSGWFDVTDGALKGAVVHIRDDGSGGELATGPFFLSAAGRDSDREALRWACDSGRGGVKATTVSDFLDQCKTAVRSKLLLPDTADFRFVGIAQEVVTTAECGHAWTSNIESKNALNVDIKHTFTCTYSPKRGVVEASIAR